MTERQMGTDDGQVMFGNGSPDYAGVEVPATKPPEEFSVEERRAELLQIITDHGHPSMVNQTELAARYGVSQPMIHKDIDAIAGDVEERLGEHHELEVESVFRRSIKGLLEEEEWRKAARTAKDYSEWMTERAEIEELQEELELLKQATEFNE
jgi:hypothetical protein